MPLDWLPAARRAPLAGQPGFAWQVDCPPKICLHTTEGGNAVPSYTPGLKAPHATVLVRPGTGVDVVQHIPLDRASYSLMHPAGVVPTNGAHVFQFELAGTSEKGGPGYYWPDADTPVLRDLYAKVIQPIADAYGVQLIAPQFKAYPASYGSGNGVRLSGPAFLAWRGCLGHQHVPGNDHGDPGAFPWSRLLEIAHTPPKPPQPKPATVTIHGPVRHGDTDSTTHGSVRPIQRKLDAQVGVQVGVDGIYGRETMIAVEKWQHKHGLTADGICGPKTVASMGLSYAAR